MYKTWTCLAVSGLVACAVPTPGPVAVARLMPTQGNTTTGEVRFTTLGAKVLV